MEVTKGLNRDLSPADLPEGFYNFAKNISLTSTLGVLENEDGFLYSTINSSNYGTLITSGYSPIGTIVTKLYTVIFLTNNTNSIIGTYNEDNDTFIVVYDDTVKPLLGLSKNYPIKGEWYENFLGEITIGWTDNYQKPKVLNLEQVALVNELKDILLFTEFQQPVYDFTISGGGSLRAGTYWVYVQYENLNGAKTDWSLSSNPIYITDDIDTNPYTSFDGTAPTITGKQIDLSLTNVDTAYDKINIALQIAITGDNTQAFYQVIQQDVTSASMNISITGSENAIEITPDEVLIPSSLYTKAKAITTLNSQLFLGNLQTDESLNLQQYFNEVSVKWIYEEVNLTNKKLSRYSTEKQFAHNEVYALYAIGVTVEGKVTQAFHIPGRAVKQILVGGKTFNENAVIGSVDNLPIQVGSTGGTSYLSEDQSLSTGQVKYFQTRDTCTWDAPNQEGELGYWENQSELYPNTAEWGALAGTKVRHHRFPSFSFIKDNLYPADNKYYLDKVDKLGIKIENLNLPADIQAKLSYITIGYAKRTYNNSLLVSNETSILCGFQRTVYDQDQDTAPNSWGTQSIWAPIAVGNRFEVVKDYIGSFYKNQFAPKYPSGGNWGINGGGGGGFDAFKYGDDVDSQNFMILKAQSPNLNIDKPTLVSTYIKTQLKYVIEDTLVYENPYFSFQFGEVNYFNDSVNATVKSSRSTSENSRISKVQDFQYLIPNVNQPFFAGTMCNQGESGVALKVRQFVPITSTDTQESVSDENINQRNFGYQNSQGFNATSIIGAVSGLDFSGSLSNGVSALTNDLDKNYASYIYSIIKFKENCYTTFSEQDIVGTGVLIPLNNISQSVFNADCFLDIYSTHSSTKFMDMPTPTTPVDPIGANNCFKAQYNLWTETNKNIGLRYGSYYRSSSNNSLLTDMNAGVDNEYQLNLDFNNINNTIETTVFNTSRDFTNSFPHRIIRSQAVTTESKIIQWREFLANDYYEINKSKGFIVNLQGYKDQLLIHAERALYYTRDKSRLNSSDDLNQIQLTSGDLFDFQPVEVFPTTNGYTGTQHIFSCLLSRFGYSWIDAEQGKVFIWNGSEQANEISIKGLINFFKENKGKFTDNAFTTNGITSTWNNDQRILLFTVKNNEKEFTLSYAPELNGEGGWVSYHDYIADHLFATRQNTFSFKNGFLYRHNEKTLKGKFYETTKQSSFVDVVFKDKNVYDLYNVNWYTQYINQNESSDFYKTLTHISIRNQHQHSGRIPLTYDNLQIANSYNSRNSESRWSFDQLRSIVIQQNSPIVQNLFNNFDPITSNLNPTMVWFDRMLFNNKWFIIRLEYDNLVDSKVQLLDVDVNAKISLR